VKIAIRSLGPVVEPATFWSTIVNDESYSLEHRRRCAIQLFKRHVRAGMTLGEVAETLGRPKWLFDNHINRIQSMFGYHGVDFKTGCTLLSLNILPPKHGDEWGVYLRVVGHVKPHELGQVLRGEPGGERLADVKLDAIDASDLQDLVRGSR